MAEKLTLEIKPDLIKEANDNFNWSEGNTGNAASDYGLQNLSGQQGRMSNESELLQSAVRDTIRNSEYYGDYLRKLRAAELSEELASKVLLLLQVVSTTRMKLLLQIGMNPHLSRSRYQCSFLGTMKVP